MAAKLPLAVDLDGTLVKTDLFTRAMLRFCSAAPWNVFTLLAWLTRGRAHAKQRLTLLYPVDTAALPYNAPFVAWLREERAEGRVIALATAFDQSGAEAVATHLGLFDHVFASDGRSNLKSTKKADRLRRAFPDGFVYAGNERADLKVWAAAKAAVVVNASPALEREAARRFQVERVFRRDEHA
jgi:beta-phosphoglucomutase-like phosphatase (HAD superfamily)